MDMVSNPQFKEEDLIPEREVVFEEYKRALDNPSQYNFSQIMENSFEGAYAHQILGNPQTILNFSVNQLNDFRNSHYNIANSLLVVSGDFELDKASKIIETYKMPEGKETHFPEFHLKKSSHLNIHTKDVKQAVITYNWESPAYLSKESAARDLALSCLAHGESSRLYQYLVIQKKLINSLSASTMFFAKGGIHFLRFSLPFENIEKTMKEIENFFHSIQTNPLLESEMSKIKNQYIASKIYEKESIESFSFSRGHGFAQNGDIHCEDKYIETIASLSCHDVNHGLKEILATPNQVTLQIADEFKKIIPSLKKKLSTHQKNLNIKNNNLKNHSFKISKSHFDSEVRKIEIAENVTFVHRYHPMTPTFSMQLFAHGGLIEENAKTNGLYNLIARTLTYNYDGIKYEDLTQDLENKSASLSGIAGKNAYGISLHGQTKDITSLLEHFFQTWFAPSFTKKYFDLEKKLILRALENKKRDPAKQVFQELGEIIFNTHPYSLDVAGNEKSLKSLSVDLVKKTHLANTHKKPVVITYVGDLPLDECLNYFQKYLNLFAKRSSSKKLNEKIISQNIFDKHLVFDREQTQMFIAFNGYHLQAKENLYLKILTAHLSGQGSDLFVEVRDRQGLCYAVQPVHFAGLSGGYWGIYIGAGHGKEQLAASAILGILEKLASDGLSELEFTRTLKMIKGNHQLSLQTNDDYANAYTIPTLQGLGIDYTHQNQNALMAVKLEDLNKFLKKYLKQKRRLISAGKK